MRRLALACSLVLSLVAAAPAAAVDRYVPMKVADRGRARRSTTASS